jgi:hypothetical protein
MYGQNRKKMFLAISGAVLAAAFIGGVSATQLASGDDEPKTKNSIIVDLTGKWHQTEGAPGMIMDAIVEGESIQVNVITRDSSTVYWMGSFNENPTSSKIVSLADPDAQKVMSGSIFGLQDPSKTFNYEDGVLSFKYETSTVQLEK